MDYDLDTSDQSESLLRQISKYGLVGLGTNAFGYMLFLFVTFMGIGPKVSMTAIYCISVFVSYLLNYSWTFKYRGGHTSASIKYFICHAFGYLLNLTLLFIGTDLLGYPYQLIQLIAVFIVAAFLFLTFRILVFEPQGSGAGTDKG